MMSEEEFLRYKDKVRNYLQKIKDIKSDKRYYAEAIIPSLQYICDNIIDMLSDNNCLTAYEYLRDMQKQLQLSTNIDGNNNIVVDTLNNIRVCLSFLLDNSVKIW